MVQEKATLRGGLFLFRRKFEFIKCNNKGDYYARSRLHE